MITGFGEDELYQALEKGPDPECLQIGGNKQWAISSIEGNRCVCQRP
jgi:hypothetical protein